MKKTCPHCNSENISFMSRVVGYFSKTQNWSKSKQEEKVARERASKFYSVKE